MGCKALQTLATRDRTYRKEELGNSHRTLTNQDKKGPEQRARDECIGGGWVTQLVTQASCQKSQRMEVESNVREVAILERLTHVYPRQQAGNLRGKNSSQSLGQQDM
jgi:hypothetical protein